MRQTYKMIGFVLAGAFAFAPRASAQSLGDVARQHRQEEQSKAANDKDKPKVFTNENIPHSADDSSASAPESESTASAPSAEDAAESKEARGEKWKNAIREQKDAIARAQADLDKYSASIHFVEANRYSNGAQYNQYQAKRQEEAQRYQKRIDEAKQKLQDLQDKCRREGFGSSVYDP